MWGESERVRSLLWEIVLLLANEIRLLVMNEFEKEKSKMSYDVLEKEIRALPESYISEISQFIMYLKLKDHFSDFESNNSYESALSAWRNGSKSLFENPSDAAFMQNAFRELFCGKR
ncbi:MAG: hypothetical protein IJJ71_10705 [Treponema sp.]|uniref:hypothetical protein n=1 Tax=Treponema sp. TaxID=166 RepID=UPI0025F3848A|nr:hypothetical protein [Treponema sp.]MBR0496631.1 hypothetical protein [Treponema sp.]